jgi:hypothetical protein
MQSRHKVKRPKNEGNTTKSWNNATNTKIANMVSTRNNVMDFYILEHYDNDCH